MVQLELSDPQQGGKSLETLIEKLGRIDALVNNAGTNVKADFLDIKFEDWRRSLPLTSTAR